MQLPTFPNPQAIEPIEYDPAGHLDVFKIWDTIQGEGPFAGMPAVFVRLAGCNLQCPACDTDYTSRRTEYSPDSLVMALRKYKRKLIVLTGGEPFRQNIVPFVHLAIAERHIVQIETNGTLSVDAMLPVTGCFIVCSPKTPKLALMDWQVDNFKYVVQSGHISIEDGLPTNALGMSCGVYRPSLTRKGQMHPSHDPEDIFIQPLDEQDPVKNAHNLACAKAVCMQFGYRLCLQLHKIIGVE